ncbi:LysR family transcriptional regulator [Vineibacter terrae]|uniref:LysR family transcriptional regulator n=1 Tax=Vineibacter terrae TaxID=2586908 RepID=UPI002E35CBF3|nr:LysR family transcriptional regulator [Vineibacter terrae]HEX2889049.1 LysR family transcriptional regulator [Vineibacter terrae]
MDAEALRTFLTVHRQRGFSNAARRLHRTQPAISRRISLLEQELGAPLFERVSGGTMLSQAGRVLLPYAERALAALQDAENAVRALASTASGPVTLAAVGTLAGTRLTRILGRFARAHPDVDLSLTTATSADVSDLVRRGEAIIGLRYFDDSSPDISSQPVATEDLVVTCAPQHALAGRTVKSLAMLRAERWLAFPEVPGRREIAAAHVFALFLARGVGEIPWTPIDSLTAQKRLVEAGFGLALMPRSSIGEELAARTLSTIKVGDLKAGQPIVAVTRSGGFLSPAARQLLEMLHRDYGRARS